MAGKSEKKLIDIDEYMSSLESGRKYAEGWPEDRWEQEMDAHPFFMTKPPKPTDELHPMVQGIQELKFSETENTPDELANTYKEEGNEYVRVKNYKDAIVSYTEGLKKNCDLRIKAVLFNNRATANFFLKNYGMALKDCEECLRLDPSYEKAKIRKARCLFHVGKFQECVKVCEEISHHEEMRHLQTCAIVRFKMLLKDERQLKRKEYVMKHLRERWELSLKKRGVKMVWEESRDCAAAKEEFYSREIADDLVWTVIFAYPEYAITDIVEEFNENDTFGLQLKEILKDPPPWDAKGTYTIDTINVYYCDERFVEKIELECTLKEVLSKKFVTVHSGKPLFYVFVAGSHPEQLLLRNKKLPTF